MKYTIVKIEKLISSTEDLKIDALVLIDIQNTTINEEFEKKEWGLTTIKCRLVLPIIKTLIANCRKKNIQIIHVLTTNWIESKLPNNLNKLYRENPEALFYTDEMPKSLISKVRGDVVFRKNMPSAFGGTKGQLENYVKIKYGVTPNLLICGYYSTGCVNATIVDGFHKGIFWYIPHDCVETFDRKDKQKYQKMILKDWSYMYGHVKSSSEILSSLGGM